MGDDENDNKLPLKKAKRLRSVAFDYEVDPLVPIEFRCPISQEIMNDPVILSSAKTYGRPSIDKWLKGACQMCPQGACQMCPQTRQVLSHVVLTPNHVFRELIQQWCKDHDVQLPPPVQDLDNNEVEAKSVLGRLTELLGKLSPTLPDQKQAAKEIRLLTKTSPSICSVFGKSKDAIQQLLNPLSQSGNIDDHPDLQEDLIAVLFNISTPKENKKIIGEHSLVIQLLVQSLTRGNINTRSNSAATLYKLSALDSNRVLIGEACAMKPLIDLLSEGHPLAMKDVAKAIFSLCWKDENAGRAVSGGIVRVILGKLKGRVLIKESLKILLSLATHEDGIKELVELGEIDCLLDLIREGTTEQNQRNCLLTLKLMCENSRDVCRAVGVKEKEHGTISMLAKHGNTMATSIVTAVSNIPSTSNS